MVQRPLFLLSCTVVLALLPLITGALYAAAPDLGLFGAQLDVGSVSRPGTLEYDARAKTYTIGASGENMWFQTDAFHFVYKEAKGDVALAADIRFVGTGGH